MPGTNRRGNIIYEEADADRMIGDPRRDPRISTDASCQRDEDGRYYYDDTLLVPAGWKQFDTKQDASYFGVWVNVEERKTFTYCEGDGTLVVCPTLESFKAELAHMCECYGKAPPAWIAYDFEGKIKTEIYDPWPTAEGADNNA